eukprot:5129668-Prymnesium_polylepis.2
MNLCSINRSRRDLSGYAFALPKLLRLQATCTNKGAWMSGARAGAVDALGAGGTSPARVLVARASACPRGRVAYGLHVWRAVRR